MVYILFEIEQAVDINYVIRVIQNASTKKLRGKPMFTKQHYKAIAEIIKTQKDLADVFAGKQFATQRIDDIVMSLADYFAQDNPQFNRVKFLEACGI